MLEVEGGKISGIAPVQGEGIYDGHKWYFRARYDSWSLSIADGHDDPIGVRWQERPGWYYQGEYGDEMFSASAMPYEDAWEIIKDCFEKYKRNEGYFRPSENG